MSIPEFLGGFTINLAFITNGFALAYPTIALSQLTNNGTESCSFVMSKEEGSWFAGLLGIGGICGSVFFGTLIGQRIGNRKTLLLAAILDIIGWLLIAFAVNSPMMMGGRFLNGVFVGTIGPSGYTFLSEIMHRKHRASCSQATSVAISAGMLVTYGLGSVISWNLLAIGCGISSVLFFIMLLTMPDSPYWNASIGKIEEAKKSLSHFRSKKDDVEEEFKEIMEGIQKSIKKEKISFFEAMKLLFTDETCYKPFIILSVLFLIQTLSGLYAVIAYAIQVLEESRTPIDTNLGTIISGAMRLFFGTLAIPLFFYLPRKTLMYISTGLACLSISSLGILGLLELETNTFTTYFPVGAISLYMVSFTFGFQSIPFLYLGEYYPPHVRQHLAGLTSTLRFLGFFIMLKLFPQMMEFFGPNYTFIFLGLVCLFAGIYAKVVLPETKGLTLNQIQDLFRTKKECSDVETNRL
uniref:Facilitated trehalose transporter Tret1like [Acyrthosiphon pisum] n=1 Tax=Lepeophtheirus salmonis TaxID=72036 RepID=A0A0K2T1P1_LEPSM